MEKMKEKKDDRTQMVQSSTYPTSSYSFLRKKDVRVPNSEQYGVRWGV
jgi:hypothetical protein